MARSSFGRTGVVDANASGSEMHDWRSLRAQRASNSASVLERVGVSASERDSISQETDRRLADMSPEQIEEARRELLSALDPSMVVSAHI